MSALHAHTHTHTHTLALAVFHPSTQLSIYPLINSLIYPSVLRLIHSQNVEVSHL